LFAVVAVEIAVTYSRFGAGELYHVSGSGPEGGASRVLVFLNYPLALVSIALLLLLVERWRWIAAVGIVLCAVVFWPGVVDPGDLDAKWSNAFAAVGVAVAFVLTVLTWRADGCERSFDRVALWPRVAVAAAAFAIAVPWIAAESGGSFAGVPVLGTLWQTTELRDQPGNPALHPAVHHGHHHGMDGTLLVWSALLLLPLVRRVGSTVLRGATLAYLSLMLCYGASLIANDAWLEQIVKRGWTEWEIPDPTQPSVSAVWGVIVAAAVSLFALLAARGGRKPAQTAR
jgi:hypothetical protein